MISIVIVIVCVCVCVIASLYGVDFKGKCFVYLGQFSCVVGIISSSVNGLESIASNIYGQQKLIPVFRVANKANIEHIIMNLPQSGEKL